MKLDVNYYYTQRFLPTKRHRNERTRKVADVVAVNTTELTAEDFPVAFIIHDYQSVQDDMCSYKDYQSDKCDFRMFSEEIRTYKGKLYMPVRVTYGAAISTVFESSDYVVQSLERITEKGWHYRNENEFSENSVIIADDKKRVRRQIRERAKRYLCFDGKFWSECKEPRYMVLTFGLGHNHGGTGFFIEYGYNPNIPSNNYFNALQRDEAIAYGKSVALGRGDTESVDGIGEHDNIEVVMPEMVKLNPKKEHGNGCEFMNMMEDIISHADSKNEAALLCMATAMAVK